MATTLACCMLRPALVLKMTCRREKKNNQAPRKRRGKGQRESCWTIKVAFTSLARLSLRLWGNHACVNCTETKYKECISTAAPFFFNPLRACHQVAARLSIVSTLALEWMMRKKGEAVHRASMLLARHQALLPEGERHGCWLPPP